MYTVLYIASHVID